MKSLPGETRGRHLRKVEEASISEKRGELPWFVEVNGGTWGIFRHKRDAVQYLAAASGIPIPEIEEHTRGDQPA